MSFRVSEVVGRQQGTVPDSKSRSSAPSMDFTMALVIDVPCWRSTRRGCELTFGQPAHSRGEIADRRWWSVGCGEDVASRDVDIGVQPDHD